MVPVPVPTFVKIKVPVPVPAPYLDHKKQIFQKNFEFVLTFYLVSCFTTKKLRFRFHNTVDCTISNGATNTVPPIKWWN
jgi:hypothetical protein